MSHIVDCSKLPQFIEGNSCFLYDGNQLSKGHYNDDVWEVVVDGNKQNVHIRSLCSISRYAIVSVTTPIAPLQTQKSQKCPNHSTSQLTPNGKCPVYVVYVYPTNYQEKPQEVVDGHCKRQCTSQSVAELCHSQTKSHSCGRSSA